MADRRDLFDPNQDSLRNGLSKVWQFPQERGYAAMLASLGSTPVAVLAGFNLFTVVGLSQRSSASTWSGLGLLLHTLAVGALLITMLLSTNMDAYRATPEQRLSWHPEAMVDSGALSAERKAQLVDFLVLRKYYARIQLGVTTGLVCTNAGLACIILSDEKSWWALGSAVVLFLLVLITFTWMISRPSWLFVGPAQVGSVDVPELSEDQLGSVIRREPRSLE